MNPIILLTKGVQLSDGQIPSEMWKCPLTDTKGLQLHFTNLMDPPAPNLIQKLLM